MKKLALLFILLIALSSKGTAQKPNIIFFLVDDFGIMDISRNGSQTFETPHIDQLAADGVYFPNARCAHPRCTPSRYAMASGRYPARVGYDGFAADSVRKTYVSVAEALEAQKAGAAPVGPDRGGSRSRCSSRLQSPVARGEAGESAPKNTRQKKRPPFGELSFCDAVSR